MTKSRWLKVDTSDKDSYENTLALIKTIHTVEQKQKDGKIYVRFVINKSNKRRSSGYGVRLLTSFSRKHTTQSEDYEESRQYCAVMIK